MLSFLDFLGTLGSNVIGFPGILGFAFGMMTRNWIIAALAGAVVGVIQTFLFTDRTVLFTYEMSIAIAVGIVFGLMGCALRHKGATI
ncbi:MAG: hypothetical protein Q4G14_02880 [Paracoccus sp. (in: a-proteobacteria)]|uniref:hypothetical protein n=1 Tax=Paracoccus sp. TaxID=267 RepID=UPI0026E07F87|nr:hypothetical protein [Paracoccus sp. (in: a-proteobacteria)]MDO5612170.1 hypothetical protein [Paracoccus sp. (in: a-proteobacteria)]